MNELVHIPEPCDVSWKSMTPCSGGRHCSQCETTVVDFSNKSMVEIQEFFSAHGDKPLCGQYQKRHTVYANRWEKMLNRIEYFFAGSSFKKVSLLSVSFLLILSGCYRRMGGAKFHPAPKKQGGQHAVSSFLRKSSLLFITMLLIFSGCHRHLRGKFRPDPKKLKSAHKTISNISKQS